MIARVLTPLALAALGFAGLVGCTTSEPGTPTAAPPHRPGAPNAQPSPAGPPRQHLGDLDPLPDPTKNGAPFDPCAVIGWSDFPEGARDPKQPRPFRDRVNTTKVGAACEFEATKPARPNANSNVLLASVVWYKPGQLKLGAAANPPAVDHQYAGKKGWRKEQTRGDIHACISYVVLAGNHVAAVGAVNTRYPAIGPCQISDKLAETIAQRVT